MPCKVTYHKYNHRNDSADVSEDIYKDSEQREVSVGSDLVPDDNESFVKDLDPELQEVYCRIVERVANDRDKSEGVGMVVEEIEDIEGGKGGDSVLDFGMPVRNPEDRVEEPVKELSTYDSVSPSPHSGWKRIKNSRNFTTRMRGWKTRLNWTSRYLSKEEEFDATWS